MKKLLLLILFISCIKASASHTTYEYIGTLTLDEGGILTYKLVFEQDESYFISGYSITDIYGEDYTKTSIMGSLNEKKGKISYKELNNLEKKEGEEDSTFCFVETKNLSMKSINGTSIISGRFKAIYPSGEIGASGDIFLIESNIKKKIDLHMDSAKLASYITEKSPTKKSISEPSLSQDSIQILQKHIRLLSEKENLVMTGNEKLLVNYSGNRIYLEIWDGADLDGDSIRVLINENVWSEAIRLKKEKQKIELPDSLERFTLKVEALNNGEKGKNTVNFIVCDSVDSHSFTSRLNAGESFETFFQKQ